MAGCGWFRRDRRRLACSVQSSGGPAKSWWGRLREWTNTGDHCVMKKRKQMKPRSQKKLCNLRSWCSSGSSVTLVGQKGNRPGREQPRRLLECVGDNLFVLIINEPGDVLLVLLLINKEELIGGVKTEIGLYNSPEVVELGVLREGSKANQNCNCGHRSREECFVAVSSLDSYD